MTSAAAYSGGITVEKLGEAQLKETLLALLQEERVADDTWRAERDAAEKRWVAQREQIREDEVIDSAHEDDVVRSEREMEKKQHDRKEELKAAAAERDAVIARAKAEYEKKAGELNRGVNLQREALKGARSRLKQAGEERDARVHDRYRKERPPFFAKERELRAASEAASERFRNPLNAAPPLIREAIFRAMRPDGGKTA